MNRKLTLVSLLFLLLSGCSICLVCDGLKQPRCKTALIQNKPLLDSLYLKHFKVSKWAVTDCDCQREDKGLVMTTITNPADGEAGVILEIDSDMKLTEARYVNRKIIVYH